MEGLIVIGVFFGLFIVLGIIGGLAGYFSAESDAKDILGERYLKNEYTQS